MGSGTPMPVSFVQPTARACEYACPCHPSLCFYRYAQRVALQILQRLGQERFAQRVIDEFHLIFPRRQLQLAIDPKSGVDASADNEFDGMRLAAVADDWRSFIRESRIANFLHHQFPFRLRGSEDRDS